MILLFLLCASPVLLLLLFVLLYAAAQWSIGRQQRKKIRDKYKELK